MKKQGFLKIRFFESFNGKNTVNGYVKNKRACL